jgi:hypothetical protein
MNIKQAIQEIALSVENGTANPAETYALLYGISKTVDDCMAMIKESAIAEVAKHGKEGVSYFGLHLSTKGSGGRWNYKSVEVHNELSKKIKMVEELAQTAYRTGGGIADPDGQVIQAAVYLPGGDTIVCTKTKQQ